VDGRSIIRLGSKGIALANRVRSLGLESKSLGTHNRRRHETDRTYHQNFDG